MSPCLHQPWLAPFSLFTLAAAVRAVQLNAGAEFDELYHVLAARAWLVEGELRIAEGVYERTALYTHMMAGFFALLGESLEVARLPSVLAGAGLVTAVFVWTRRTVGSCAAYVAALLVCFWPDGIAVSRFARFYALHGLLFWLGAVGVYSLVTRASVRPWWLAGGTVVAIAAATYLQVITLIGLIGVALWTTGSLGSHWLRAVSYRRALGAGVFVFAAVLVVTVVLLQSGLGAELITRYRDTPPWLDDTRNDFWYYHLQFLLDYPTLWPLSALAVLVGLAARPQPTAYCTCVFALAFLVHSFAGPKLMRYVYYFTPFLFVVWATALTVLWGPLWRVLKAQAARALGGLGLARPGSAPGSAAAAGTLIVLVVAVLLNGVAAKTLAALVGFYLPPNTPPPDWAAARGLLTPRLEHADVVLTTSELEALYYLGRYDVLVSRSRLHEVGGEEFARDERTGLPVIAAWASLNLIIDCYDDGLIVSSDRRWRNPAQLDDAVANLIAARTRQIDLQSRGVRAYSWQHPEGAPGSDEICAALRSHLALNHDQDPAPDL